MSEGATPENRGRPRVPIPRPSPVWTFVRWVGLVFTGTCMLVFAAIVFAQLGFLGTRSKNDAANAEAKDELTPERIAAARALAEARAEEQFARSKNQELLSAATNALEVADAAEQERVKFDAAKDRLLDGDDGKRLAKNAERVALLRAVIDSPRASASEAKGIRLQLAQLADMASERMKGVEGAVAPTAELFESVDSLRDQADVILKSYREGNEELESLVTASKTDADGGDLVNARTAKLALMELTRKEAERRAARIEEIRKKTEEEETQKLVAVEEAATRQKAEIARSAREAELKRGLAEAEFRRKEERLWRIAKSPRAKELLYPAVARSAADKSSITWKAWALGGVFRDRDNFIGSFKNTLGSDAIAEYERRAAACKAEFGMTLHELFREVCLRDQENAFLSRQDISRLLEQAQNLDERGFLTSGNSNGVPPPKPLVKPDWLSDTPSSGPQ